MFFISSNVNTKQDLGKNAITTTGFTTEENVSLNNYERVKSAAKQLYNFPAEIFGTGSRSEVVY